jgi:acyl carrier protein
MAATWQDIRAWIVNRNPDAEGHVGADTDIIDSRIVNSLQFVELLLYVEKLSGCEIAADDVDIDMFRTPRVIAHNFLNVDALVSRSL